MVIVLVVVVVWCLQYCVLQVVCVRLLQLKGGGGEHGLSVLRLRAAAQRQPRQ